MGLSPDARLRKQLGLFDVYVLCTGSMFSSGFFLLPGVAVAIAGPAAFIAYFVSGLLIVPAMLSKAELATAMPRAGGTYYFLDRTLGPLVGAVGGVSTWLALLLKSAFALIGMGAYLSLFLHVPFKPAVVLLAIAFGGLNVWGTKESSRFLRILVVSLLGVLVLFVVHGLIAVSDVDPAARAARFTPFMPNGLDGIVETVGLVFVSYIGLTKVASLAEEINDPERNIPLGMTLALGSVILIYVSGVFIMVAVLDTATLSTSLTPAADAARAFATWIPPSAAMTLVAVAAIVAFVSMSNAGIMAASRYPLAMARDGLAPPRFAAVGRFGTPTASILLTVGLIIVVLLLLDVVAVAKLAGALQLLLFAMVNVAVIVMRESGIESYDPGFRSPLYPWMQLVGVFFPLYFVSEMGWLPALFSFAVIFSAVAWYRYYTRGQLAREGAIFHVFERLGRRRFASLDRELRDIMKEKGVRASDPFDEIVARAFVIDLEGRPTLTTLVRNAAQRLATRLPVTATQLADGLDRVIRAGDIPISHGVAIVHTRLPGFDGSELVLVRCRGEVMVEEFEELPRQRGDVPIQAVFFLASGELDPGRHLRILAGIAGRVEDETFITEWIADRDEQELKETLLRDERFLSLRVARGTKCEPLIGQALRDLHLPDGSLVALITRGSETLIPRGRTVLLEGDRLTIIAEPAGLRAITKQYGGHRSRP